MDNKLDNSEPSSPPWDMEEPTTPGPLNTAVVLGENEFLYGDMVSPGRNPNNSLLIIDETPSPQCHRRRHRYHGAENNATASLLTPPLGGNTPVTPTTHFSKRRRLSVPATSLRGETNPMSWRTNGFVPASSLLETDFSLGTWLESPCPPPSSLLPSHSSLGSGSALAGGMAGEGFYCNTQEPVVGPTVDPRHCRRSKRTSKQSNATKSSSLGCSSTHDNTDSTSTVSTGKNRLRNPRKLAPPTTQEQLAKHEEIVISDDDSKDVIIQAMVHSVQMEEDEAFARSLQEQFDREEQQQRSRQEAVPSSRPQFHHHNYSYDPHFALGWMSPWASAAMNQAAFSPLLAEFGGGGRRTGRDRSRGRSRRRNDRSHLAVFDPLHHIGDSYEALLAFEEHQGAVVAKNALSKRELESLPTKSYNPAHNAGKTQCQICFSDYTEGEELRMLPCLHDYHVQCIDRWLKESTTCPICRADVSEMRANMV